MKYKKIRDCCSVEKDSIMPNAGTEYTLYSLPAFDADKTPEVVDGSMIKSGKFNLSSNTILFNKLNVHFRRIWNIHDLDTENNICSTEFIPLKANESVITQDYLYYNLLSEQLNETMYANRTGTSSSQQRISPDTLLDYEIGVPDLNYQKKAASILRAIDDKIAMNYKAILLFEDLSATLFKKWFVERKVDCDIETDFKEVSLADLMDYAGGSQPPKSEFISEPREGYVRFVQIRDYESDEYVTYIPDSKRNKLCDEFDIMIARYGAALGRICFGLTGAYNVALAKVFPKKAYYREFLRAYLSSRDFYEGINNRGGRSAQAGFNQSDIASFKIMIPTDEAVMVEFENINSEIFKKRLCLRTENRELLELRKTMIPLLVNGEMDITNL